MPEVLAGVLTGALARARAQAGVLVAALSLLVLATALTATSARLLTSGQDAALAVALAAAPPQDVTAVARTSFDGDGDGDGDGGSATTGADQQEALDDAAAALTAGAAPAPAPAWTSWSSSARYLDPTGSAGAGRRDLRSGTLAVVGSSRAVGDDDGLAAHADLVSGRWPAPPSAGGTTRATGGPTSGSEALEVVVPEAAEGVLRPGADAVLDPAPGDETASAPLRVVVVGVYRPHAADPVWQLDPLRAAGTTTAAGVPGTSGRVQRPAVGPLLVDPAALASSGSLAAESGGAVVVPQLSGLSSQAARAVAETAGSDPSPLTAVQEALGDRAGPVRVTAPLPGLLSAAAAEQRTSGAGLVVATAVGAGVALVALAAVAQLLSERRREESALLAARGASPAQQLARDAAEVVPLALAAVVLAVPLGTVCARTLLGLSLDPGPPAPAVSTSLVAGAPLVAAAVAGVVAAVVVLLALARGRAAGSGPGPRGRAPLRGPLARSGADVLLLGVAVAAWWQLRSGGGRVAGVAGVAVPVLALLASALLGLRVIGLLRRAGERTARRGPGAPRAVAGWSLARGPVAAGTAVLVVLSAATAATALTWRAAWEGSTAQQVGAHLGADVVVTTPAGGDGGDGGADALRAAAALAAVTRSAPSPVAVLPVALGTRSGAGPVSLVSAPTDDPSLAGPVLTGPELPAGPVSLVLTGSGDLDGAPRGSTGRSRVAALRVVPSLVVRDPWGTTAVLEGEPVALDGRAHDTTLPDPGATGALQVVGVWLRFLPSDGGPDDGAADGALADADQRVELRLDLPAATRTATTRTATTRTATASADIAREVPAAADWAVTSGGDGTDGTVTGGSARVERAPEGPATGSTGAAVVVAATVRPAGLPDSGASLRVLAAAAPEVLPVVVSPELAAQVGAVPGQEVELRTGDRQVVARVAAVVPVVPVVPGAPALGVDADALDTALLAGGTVPSPDRWWLRGLDDEEQGTASAAVEAAGLGTATGLAAATERARGAPLAAPLRAAWVLLLVAAAAGALAGPALQVAAAAPEDSRTSARLAVLGVRRRDRVRAVVVPRAAQLLLGLCVGAAAGLVVAVAVVPVLVRAPGGGVAVPRVDAAGVLRAALTGEPLLEAVAVLAGLVVLTAVPLVVAGRAAARGEGLR